jgi:diguanylate cyclase (GGDEF)-like protein
LLHDAFHDSLTGLPNRALFIDHLKLAVNHCRRTRGYLFAVLFIDLDRFKVINDSLGHLVGDELLSSIAHRLEICLRDGDTIARLGGDEFTILLDGIKDYSDAQRVAERVQEVLEQPFSLAGRELFITASVGIKYSSGGEEQPEDLLRDADTAMYCAKALGKAQSQVFDTKMHTRALTLLEIESDLRRAMDREEFDVHYQPIVSLESGRISGFEALVRWSHPERGLISPADFIPIAEETGLVIQIDRWVLKQACLQMRKWQEALPVTRRMKISVNLSCKQFMQPTIVEQILETLRETGLDPCNLKLEITESVMMERGDYAMSVLEQLSKAGIELSLDDFGTGYSSLSYIHHFPVSTLKIDQSFIKRIGGEQNGEIVRAVVALARNLGLEVVAEGIETVMQLDQLKALGCEQGQGYYFSEPVDEQSATELIQKEARGEFLDILGQVPADRPLPEITTKRSSFAD